MAPAERRGAPKGDGQRWQVAVDASPSCSFELLRFFGGTPLLPSSRISLRHSECSGCIGRIVQQAPSVASLQCTLGATPTIGFCCLNYASGELAVAEWEASPLGMPAHDHGEARKSTEHSSSSSSSTQTVATGAGASESAAPSQTHGGGVSELSALLSQNKSSSCLIPSSLARIASASAHAGRAPSSSAKSGPAARQAQLASSIVKAVAEGIT